MKTLKINAVFFFLMSINAEAQWTEVTSPGSVLTDIATISENIAYGIHSSNKMYRTFDGGKTWSSVTVNVGTNFMTSHNTIQFINSNIGFVGGMTMVNGGVFGGGYEAPRIYKTTNGGISWSDISPPEIPEDGLRGINYFYFFNQLTGLAFANYGGTKVWRTTNGGLSWKSQAPLPIYLYDVSFDQNGQGYAAGISSDFHGKGAIAFTNDFGRTWLTHTINDHSAYIKDIELIDENTVYALNYPEVLALHPPYLVGEPKIFTSFDNGTTWDTIHLPMYANNIHFFNKMEGFLVGPGDNLTHNTRIFSTVDGGQNWTLELTISKSGATKMRFNKNAGYIIGIYTNAVFVAKYTDTVNAYLNEANGIIFSIYPNPAQSTINIHFDAVNKTNNIIFSITDISGKIVKSKIVNVSSGIFLMDVSDVRTGQYILQIQHNGEILDSKKIIITNSQ
ncbi:MAG: T9SS type A sorting domain-containing protein [Cytophagales bacterium]|nr:T9SS type A sorting domain-containing protein [Cytophagales bacterium]